jgi:glycerol uptake facilitator-like aquaporin
MGVFDGIAMNSARIFGCVILEVPVGVKTQGGDRGERFGE